MRRARQPDLAAGDPPGRIDEADDRRTRYGLAGAGFAHDAEHLALGDVEGDAVDGLQNPASRDELDAQVPDGEDWFCHDSFLSHRSFGLSASRSQSPRRLMASTRSASAMPGKATIHHSPENR